MKKARSVLSILLSFMMVFTALLPVSAVAVEDTTEAVEETTQAAGGNTEDNEADAENEEKEENAELEAQWNNTAEAKRGININPGKTDSERNFSWYMSADAASCAVEISEKEDMSDAVSFTGEAVTTYQGDKAAKVTVTGLEENKTYYYTCVSGEEKSEVYSFSTDDDTFSALYMSDIHVYDDPNDETSLKSTSFDFAELLEKANTKADINFVLSGGDMATEGQRVEYEGLSFSRISRETTIAHVMGNHDRHSFDFKYYKNFPNEMFGPMAGYQSGNYYFEKGGALFICIDTNNASAQAHRSTVKDAVKNHPDATWRIVMMHHDLYGGSIPHRETECNLFRILFSPMFDEFDIDLVLMGHSHHYSVSDVIYNGKSVETIENGETINNAKGTVYFVSTSIGRPEEDAEITPSDLVSISIDKLTDSYYNILDFSPDALKVTSYYLDSDEEYVSFTLTKDDDYEVEKVGFFRKLGGILAGFLSTVYGIYVNADRYFSLKEDGYTGVGFFEFVF